MTLAVQETLLQLFDHVRQDPDTLPTVPIEDWQEGSVEWSLLSGFQDMLEKVQQRMHQFMEMELLLREREEQYRSIFEASTDGVFTYNCCAKSYLRLCVVNVKRIEALSV